MSLLLDELILKRVSTSLGGRMGEGENKAQKVKQGNMFLVGRGGLKITVLDLKFFQGRNCFLFLTYRYNFSVYPNVTVPSLVGFPKCWLNDQFIEGKVCLLHLHHFSRSCDLLNIKICKYKCCNKTFLNYQMVYVKLQCQITLI